MGGIGGRGGVRLCRVQIPQIPPLVEALLLLDGFGMAVWGPATTARSLEGTRDVEGGAGPAGRP